ncbi:MAG TPA: 50S ribosomal protein L25 [Ktedonobacteraceae bacterium]|nr:50S ribosomal protein L25 [Ktedonobacteraceae bacterium]
MAKHTELAVSPREVTGKATRQLRATGLLPANIFGQGTKSQTIQLSTLDFDRLRNGHHTSVVIVLRIEGTLLPQMALVRHVQRHPITEKVLHIDFLRIDLKERVTARLPLHFEGDAPAVKAEGGMVLHLLETLEVECAAGDIIQFLSADISHLESIDAMLHAKDIKLPPNYTLLADPDEPVVKITQPRGERVVEGSSDTLTTATPTLAAGS